MEYKINEIEAKNKGTKYWHVVKTDKGNFICWNKDIVEEIKEYLNGMCTLIIEDKNGFNTIVGLANDLKVNKEIKAIDTPKPITNLTPMYVSYAKDVFIALWTGHDQDQKTVMTQAIELVKQARDEFK